MKKKISWVGYIVIFIILYIYIFNPIFAVVNFGLVKILLLFSVFFYLRNKDFRCYFIGFKKESHIFFFALIYCTVVILITGGNASKAPYSMLVWYLENTFIPIYLIHKLYLKYELSLIDSLIPISFFAAIISIFLLINPSVNNYILGSVIRQPFENIYGEWTRTFGIAEGLTSSYGFIQGIFASICLLRGRKNSSYYFIATIIASSAIINARTGIVPFVITLLYVFYINIKKLRLSYILVFSFLAYILFYVVHKYGEEYSQIEHSLALFTSTYDYAAKGEEDDYFGALNGFIHFPKTTIGIIFGEGNTRFGAINQQASDIGFINQIYTGGLVWMFTLIYLQIIMYRNMYKRYTNKFLVLLFFMSACVFNFKGLPFCTSESFSRFVMLFYFIVLHNKLFPNNQVKIGL